MSDLHEQMVRAADQVPPTSWASAPELRSAGHRRLVRRRVLVSAAFAVAGLVAWALWPAGTVDRSQRSTTTPSIGVCTRDTCRGGSPMRVVGPPVPIVWTLPAGWEQAYKAGSSYEDVSAGSADGTVGFVLMENVAASDPIDDNRPPTDPPAAGARALAAWLATRPYLHTTPPTQTTVGGQPAWQLDAQVGTLPPHAPTFGTAGVPGVYLVRVLPPVSDIDTAAAWFDRTYTTPSHLWLIDLPNGMIGYVEAGSGGGQSAKAEIDRVLQQMRFEQPGSS